MASPTLPLRGKSPGSGAGAASKRHLWWWERSEVRRDAELERLVGLMKQHEMGEIPESKWLDQMVFRQIEKLERQQVKDDTRPTFQASESQDVDLSQQMTTPLCADGDSRPHRWCILPLY